MCFNLFFNFYFNWRLITLQYCSGFCHTLTWISHGWTCVPHPEPLSHHPLGHPSAPALSTLSHASNLDWQSVLHTIIYIFQCYSLKSSYPRLLPQSPKDCSIHLCLFCCLAYRVIVTIFLNSIYVHQYTVLDSNKNFKSWWDIYKQKLRLARMFNKWVCLMMKRWWLNGLRGRINHCKFLAPKQVRWKPVTTWSGSLPAECFLMFFILGKLRLSWYSTSYVLHLPCSQLCGNRLIPALFRWGSGRTPVSAEVCWFLFCLGHYCWGTLDTSLDL